MPRVQNRDLGTRSRKLCKNKHKNMVFAPNFSIKMRLSSRTYEKPFSFSKTNFKSMHDMQNRFDHAMQLDDQ